MGGIWNDHDLPELLKFLLRTGGLTDNKRNQLRLTSLFGFADCGKASFPGGGSFQT
jgi:hypothetical protein